MSEKIIYVLVEKDSVNDAIKSAYGDPTIDLPFDIDKPMQIWDKGLMYRVPLGIRTFTDKGAGSILMVPRSSSGNLLKREAVNVVDRFPLGVKVYNLSSIRLANTVGVIDASYRGEWLAMLVLDGIEKVTLNPGTPYLQAFCTNPEYNFKVVRSIDEVPEALRETERGANGFGSSSQPPK